MITAICAVANGGYLVQPHVVDRIVDSEGNVVQTTDTSYKRQVISEDVSARMTAILQRNATSGSGKNGYVPGYRIAGKTGTSERSRCGSRSWPRAGPRHAVRRVLAASPGGRPAVCAARLFTMSRRSAALPAVRRPARSSPRSWRRSSRTSALTRSFNGIRVRKPRWTRRRMSSAARSRRRSRSRSRAQLHGGRFTGDNGGRGDRSHAGAVAGRCDPEERQWSRCMWRSHKEEDSPGAELVGCSLDDCNYLAEVYGVQIVVSGSGRSSGYAQGQDIAAGTRVKRSSRSSRLPLSAPAASKPLTIQPEHGGIKRG